MAKIGVIGCGWLGKPLAQYLKHSHEVQCFSRRPQKESELDYVLNPKLQDPFWKNEIFIFALSTKDDYLKSLERLVSNCSKDAYIILTSSTSVYKEFDSEVNEEVQITQAGLQKQAEDLVIGLRKNVLILRLGGLMGKDRIAGKWKSPSAYADGPVNYIHQDDVINIIAKMIEKKITNGLFNLVAPLHPLRSDIHQNNAKTFGFEKKEFNRTTGRFVRSNKLIKALSYEFIHPDPLEFWTTI